ncbi:MAG: Ppx/GppA family phosphatase [Rhodospirillales bacterium]|nr:Ppx/GppA family phosphatase [Rhodospirillales bacterium]
MAVIDIGSNSVRLVVFDGLRRAFFPLFNEKVICGLGRELTQTGRLSEDAVWSALVNVVRFTAMARAMKVAELHLLGTAAARDASNGPEFIAEVERRCGHPVRLLSGAEEARISALGVLAAFPDAEGFMGDLGGGSLELVRLGDGRLQDFATLALGPLRVIDSEKGKLVVPVEEIDRQLAEIDWLDTVEGRGFYAVGGAWRNLARIHMDQNAYPLHVLHGYTMSADEAIGFCQVVAGLGRRSMGRMTGVSRRRAETLPYSALLLGRVLRRCRPKQVVLSAYGLREGFFFERLPSKEQSKDPLVTAARDFAKREGRFGDCGAAFARWIAPLFDEDKAAEKRLRLVACHLSDFAWREHPDYRAAQAMHRILHYPFVGIDHPGRAFVACAVFVRYGGEPDAPVAKPVVSLLRPRSARRARLVGMALRLAYTLSAGAPSLLATTGLQVADGGLWLDLSGDGSVPVGEVVERRFAAVAEAADLKLGNLRPRKR